MLDHNAYKPLYTQLEEALIFRIREGNLKEGAPFPSENALCEEYNVSRITIRKALDALSSKGYIRRKQGCPTTVISSHPEKLGTDPQSSQFLGIIEELRSQNIEPSIEIITTDFVPTASGMYERLDIPESDSNVFLFSRLYRDDLSPILYNNSYTNAQIGIAIENLNFSKDIVLPYLSNLGYQIALSKSEISVSSADEHAAALLEIKKGSPIMLIERTVYTTANVPLIWSETFCRPDRYSFKVTLHR